MTYSTALSTRRLDIRLSNVLGRLDALAAHADSFDRDTLDDVRHELETVRCALSEILNTLPVNCGSSFMSHQPCTNAETAVRDIRLTLMGVRD